MENTSSQSSHKPEKYIAFFDLDRTLISVNSGKILIETAYSKGLITRLQLINAIWLSFLYKFGLWDTIKIIDSMTSWLNGIDESAMNELTKDIFEKEIKHNIRPELIEEILIHKQEGGSVVILSSAIGAICNPVAEYLDIDDVICSGLEIKEGVFTGRPSGTFCFGEEKVNRLNSYCAEKKISPAVTWYYGDSIADFPVLSATGNPVCVYPDKKLLRKAIKRNWKIISSS
jgi:HAD superfamily hydrolase (TIGR01490 family)